MNDKDIISKHLLKRMTLDMARVLLGLEIIELDILETEQQRVEERRADLVARVKDENREYILHIEIQNDNQRIMPVRMLRYYTDISLAYHETEIVQYLIYIGQNRLSMEAGIQRTRLIYSYEVLDMHSIDCENLLSQNTPEALVLAILSDFGNVSDREMVHRILQGLHELTAQNEAAFRDYLLMLEILSSNRDLKQILEEEENMISQVKYSDLPSYGLGMKKGIQDGMALGIQQGIEKGIEQGIERGIEQGMQKGVLHGEATMLQNLLQLKFGVIPDSINQRIQTANSQQLLYWSGRILSCDSLAEIFAEH